MTAVAERLRVYVNGSDAGVRAALLTNLRNAGIARIVQPEPRPPAVVLAAGKTVDAALDACPPVYRTGRYPLLVVADTFAPAGVLRAVRAGARAMMRTAEVTPARLAATVRAVAHGDGRMPYEVLIHLLYTGPEAPARTTVASPSPLTPRQTAVLRLMSEGHGNAVIARALSCSEHTVKNVIYDLMTRLQVRNRAHAVAHAVRAGLI